MSEDPIQSYQQAISKHEVTTRQVERLVAISVKGERQVAE